MFKNPARLGIDDAVPWDVPSTGAPDDVREGDTVQLHALLLLVLVLMVSPMFGDEAHHTVLPLADDENSGSFELDDDTASADDVVAADGSTGVAHWNQGSRTAVRLVGWHHCDLVVPALPSFSTTNAAHAPPPLTSSASGDVGSFTNTVKASGPSLALLGARRVAMVPWMDPWMSMEVESVRPWLSGAVDPPSKKHSSGALDWKLLEAHDTVPCKLRRDPKPLNWRDSTTEPDTTFTMAPLPFNCKFKGTVLVDRSALSCNPLPSTGPCINEYPVDNARVDTCVKPGKTCT